VTVDALVATLHRARNLFDDKEQWRQLQSNGMKTDVSWRRPARRYAGIYRGLLAARAATGAP
jgi:starch synthase